MRSIYAEDGPELLAYAAGVIDSDGSIYLGMSASGPADLAAARCIETISLGQIDVGVVDLFHRSFGGTRFVSKSKRQEARPLHCWRLTHRRACLLLERALPYFLIKRRQAQLCVEFRRLKDRTRPAATEMAAIREEILRLNHAKERPWGAAPPSLVGVQGDIDRSHGAAGNWTARELLAYAAGVIDSDGSIRIHRDTYAKRVLQTTPQATYSECVTLRQLEPEAVALLQRHFGGSRRMISPRRVGHRPLHALQVVDRQAASMLQALLPFLVIKRAQAQKCLELRAFKEESRRARFAVGRGHRGAGPRPGWIGDEPERLFEAVAALNRRAVTNGSVREFVPVDMFPVRPRRSSRLQGE